MLPTQVLANEARNSAPPEATALIEEGKKIQSMRRKILDSYHDTIFDIEPTDDIVYVEKKSEGIFSFLAILDRTVISGAIRKALDFIASVVRFAFHGRSGSGYEIGRRLLFSAF